MSERALAVHRIGEPGPLPSLRSVATLLRCWAPATVATLVLTFCALLYVSPDASRAAVVASVVVLALAATASSYVRSSLADFAQQAEQEALVQRRADLRLRQLNTGRPSSAPAVNTHVARELEEAVQGMTASLRMIADRWAAVAPAADGEQDLAAVEQAVAKAVAECNQITLSFAADLSSEQRHRFNNAVMPLSYALDKATKRLTRLLHRAAPSAAADDHDRVPVLLDGARADAERLGVLVRRLGAA